MHNIARNMIHLCIRLVLSTAAGMVSVRFVLDALGVEGYGTYAAVFGVVYTFSALYGMLENAARRFLSREIAHKDAGNLPHMFCSVLTVSTAFAACVALLSEVVGLWFVNTILEIPQSTSGMVAVVFHAGVLTMAMRTLQIPFAALITADERMSFFSRLGLFEAFCTIATAFAAYAGVTVFVVSLVLSAVAVFMLHAMFCHRKFPFLRMRVSLDRRCLSALGTFISWSTLGGIGNVLKYRGTGIIINIYAGVAFSASWRISLAVWGLLYALCTSFQQAFCPSVFKAWGTSSCKEFVRLTKTTTTISFLIAGIPATILFVFVDEFLLLWLGESMAPQLAQFVRCALVNIVFDAISCPLTAAIDATGRIVRYQIVTSSLSTLALIMASALLAVGMPPWTAMGTVATCNGIACVYRFFHVRGIVRIGTPLMSCATLVSSTRSDV